MSGATTETLTITVSPETQGMYHAWYLNDNGSTLSAPVRVVCAAPTDAPPVVPDANGDEAVDFFDILFFLNVFDAAQP